MCVSSLCNNIFFFIQFSWCILHTYIQTGLVCGLVWRVAVKKRNFFEKMKMRLISILKIFMKKCCFLNFFSSMNTYSLKCIIFVTMDMTIFSKILIRVKFIFIKRFCYIFVTTFLYKVNFCLIIFTNKDLVYFNPRKYVLIFVCSY